MTSGRWACEPCGSRESGGRKELEKHMGSHGHLAAVHRHLKDGAQSAIAALRRFEREHHIPEARL